MKVRNRLHSDVSDGWLNTDYNTTNNNNSENDNNGIIVQILRLSNN